MIVRLQRLRHRGVTIPKYQHAFTTPIEGELLISEERDPVLNRYTRIAKLINPTTHAALDVPPLRDVQIVGLTRDVMSLSGIERIEDITILKIEDFAQSWLCWLGTEDTAAS